jgi:hypothetical protein
MKNWRLWRILPVILSVAVFSLGVLTFAGAQGIPNFAPDVPKARPGDGDPWKLLPSQPAQSTGLTSPSHLTHPCGGMFPEPPFTGLSPLSFAYVSGGCGGGYGDIAVWQANGHDYVALSGFGLRMFYLYNVDDPYNPQLLYTQPFPSGGTAGTSVFTFHQGSNYYVSATMRGSTSSSSCGFFVYNVNDPTAPQLVGRKAGTDWCTVHEHFVSTDTNGDADYAWLAMGNEAGSLYKVVAVDIRNLPTMTEMGRYERPDSAPGLSGIWVHDVNVRGNRVFLANWVGGLIVHDKQTLINNINPTPLNALNSIQPASFWVHHNVPTSDGNHILLQDEFISTAGQEKIKMYNIADLQNPFYETGIVGVDTAATNRAHNMRIKNISPGHDLLFSAWYQAGTRGYEIDTTGPTPTITQVFSHQLRQTTNGQFGNVWGVDFLPCTVRGVSTICIYSGDMTYGLIVDALGYNPALDPYMPESAITSPTNGQTLTSCSVTIQGSGHDYYSGLNQVEVSIDNGATWQPASGTTNWTYQWNITADGSYTLKSRSRDQANNLAVSSTVVNVNVAGSCGGADTPTPTTQPVDTATPVPTSTAPPANTPTNTPVPPNPTATSAPCTISFSDVNTTDYFYEPVRYLTCAGAISGYSDNTFRPYNDTTRGQLSKIIVLARGWAIDTTGAPHFTDVTSTNPFYTHIETAYNHGIISGYDDGTFKWGNNVTRGQLSKITVLAMDWATNTTGGPHFTDVPTTHPFYVYIETAYNHGIISGYDDNTFRAGNPATRGQIAKIVYNAVTVP